MKTIAGALQSHIAGDSTSLSTCWKLTRADGQIFGFTDHDVDLVIAGTTYLSAIGYSQSAMRSSSDLAVDNADVQALIDSSVITHEDILSGAWDHAQVEIFKVNWMSPGDGTIPLKTGTIGEVELHGEVYRAELRGLSQALQQTLGELYSASCRANLGDARCKISLVDYTATGTVSSSSGASIVTDLGSSTVRLTPATTGAPPDAYFTGGLLTWTSGANSGRQIETIGYVASSQTLTLALTPTFGVNAGDTFSVRAGCAKTLATCRDRFGNVLNRRAEDYVPGLDRVLRSGGS